MTGHYVQFGLESPVITAMKKKQYKSDHNLEASHKVV